MKKIALTFITLLTLSFNYTFACSQLPPPFVEGQVPPPQLSFEETNQKFQNLKSDYIKKISSPFNLFESPVPHFGRLYGFSEYDILRESTDYTRVWLSNDPCLARGVYVKTYMIPVFIIVILLLPTFYFFRKRKQRVTDEAKLLK